MSATTRREKAALLATRCKQQRELISLLAIENTRLVGEINLLTEQLEATRALYTAACVDLANAGAPERVRARAAAMADKPGVEE